MKKITYIGGGVSTVFSVLELLNSGYPGNLITIIEKGNSPKNRKPNEIMNGFLGAGAFSDFKCIYSLTRGGELSKYMGDVKALKLMEKFKKTLRQFHPDKTKIETVKPEKEPDFIKKSGFELIQYEVEHIGTDYGKQLGFIIEQYFLKQKVNIHYNKEVIDIQFLGKKIICIDDVFFYDNLVIAVGKSGTDFLSHIINKYKLDTKPKATQIGVRFESDYKHFEKLAKNFYDFKLSQKIDNNINIRSFCVNNETARVAVEKTYGMESYNGHAYKDRTKYNGLINFGIMLEIKNIKKPLEFTKDLVQRCNENEGGKYYSPGDRKPTAKGKQIDLQEFMNLYQEHSLYILKFIIELDKVFGFRNDYVFYLPEIKYLVNEIETNYKDLSLIKYPNVHIIGDGLSSRGIVPAACQGIYVAETLKRGE